MTKIKQAMVDEAIEKFGDITACGDKTLEDCFTNELGLLIFWFNDNAGSTRVITKYL